MDKDDDHAVSEEVASEQVRANGLTIPWPTLSVVLTIVSVSLLGTLLIVATVSDADALSTVALVLAVLAFGAQLIVTAAQTASANEQYRQVNRLYEDTRGLLQQIGVQSETLLSNQRDQFDKILDHVLSPSALESAVAEVANVPDDESESANSTSPRTDLDGVSRVLRAEAEKALASESRARESGPPRSIAENQGIIRKFPREEEGKEVLARFESLTPEARKYIRAIAGRAMKSSSDPTRLPPSIIRAAKNSVSAHVKELESAGMLVLEPYRTDGEDRTIRRITPDGLIAIRFFTGSGLVPAYLQGLLEREAAAT